MQHKDYCWPQSLLEEFAGQYWETQPWVFSCPSSQPILSLQELFATIVGMPRFKSPDRFWIARRTPPKEPRDYVLADLSLLGPKANDASFDTFFERMNRQNFGINIHRLHIALPELWQRVSSLTSRLEQQANRPQVQRWVFDTFFGSYRATPFGIHRDPASVISYLLLGERVYYTWPEDYFEPEDLVLHTPNWEAIEPHLADAECFPVKQGQVFYWPSNRWHIATSDGKPSVVAQLSAYFRPRDLANFSE